MENKEDVPEEYLTKIEAYDLIKYIINNFNYNEIEGILNILKTELKK